MAKADTLWGVVRICLSDLASLFDRLQTAIGALDEADVLKEIYGAVRCWDFSARVVQRLPGRLSILPLQDVHWSDWGRPQRIAETLATLGKQPAFPRDPGRASSRSLRCAERFRRMRASAYREGGIRRWQKTHSCKRSIRRRIRSDLPSSMRHPSWRSRRHQK